MEMAELLPPRVVDVRCLAFSLAVNFLRLVSGRPMTVLSRLFAVVFTLFPAAVSSLAAPASGKLGYNEFIQPILAENCFACHGPESPSMWMCVSTLGLKSGSMIGACGM